MSKYEKAFDLIEKRIHHYNEERINSFKKEEYILAKHYKELADTYSDVLELMILAIKRKEMQSNER